MKKNYFLVLDENKKDLLDRFNEIHPDGGDLVFNLLLNFYIKFATWHRKKGRNPINAFEDLIERELKGGAYSADLPRLRFLNEIIEKGEDIILSAVKNGESATQHESTEHLEVELKKEIGGLKDLILTLTASGRIGRATGGSAVEMSLDDFKPTGEARLTKTEDMQPKKRLNYRDLRNKDSVKKINFED